MNQPKLWLHNKQSNGAQKDEEECGGLVLSQVDKMFREQIDLSFFPHWFDFYSLSLQAEEMLSA